MGPWRQPASGITAQSGLWEVHYDPYDAAQVFVRTTDGWITAPWTHLPMVAAPFAEFTWRYARHLAAEKGRDDTNETAVARVLDDLLTRAAARPGGQAHDRIAAAPGSPGSHRPPPDDTPWRPATRPAAAMGSATVIPFGIFDADAEADKWL